MLFDELDFGDEAPGAAPPVYPTENKYQGNKGGDNKWGGNKGGGGGGFKKFERAPEVETDQGYVPITFYVDQSFPPEVKAKFKELIGKLLSKGYVVRVNADDKEFTASIKNLADTQLELYTAWKGFNDVETKHYWNTASSKLIAAKFHSGWDKVSDVIKSFLARNARMIFGDKNASCTLALVTWSEDGASKTLEIGKATGKASHIVRMAAYYAIPIFNIQKVNAEPGLIKVFDLY